MNKRKINIKVIVLIALTIMFEIVTILVSKGKMQSFDKTISLFVQTKIPENINNFLKIITNLGGTTILPIIILTTSIILICLNKKKYGIMVIMNSILALGLYKMIKIIIHRPRPNPFRFINETGYSFPSGHATANMAFYGILILLIWKFVKNKTVKIVLTTILILWTLIIGITRIYFNVHYPSDIIAGFILGIICILISNLVEQKTKKALKKH